MATSRSGLASRISLASAALALLTCVATVLVALFLPGGHPPLSHYVGAIAVPFAWLLALLGLTAAIVSRRSVLPSRYLLALACNLAALVAGLGIWFFWPFLAA